MILVQGKDIFAEELGVADILLFTANSEVRRGQLTMGAGIAKEVKLRFPDIPQQLGHLILEKYENYGRFGVIVTTMGYQRQGKFTYIGAFQSKQDWRKPSTLELIQYSCDVLAGVVDVWNLSQRPVRIAMNFPGIGYGCLARQQVLPILEGLPDEVVVYEK